VLSDLGLREEKYRSNSTTYGTCDQVMAPSTCAALNGSLIYYTVALTAASNTATGYVYTATPKTADQLKDSCGTLTWTMNSGAVTKAPTTNGCW
jgi:Tfp pilus assembly protein PilE